MTQFPTSVFYFQGGYYPFNLFHTKKDISEFIRSYSEKRSVGFNLRDFNTEYSRALKKSDNVIIFVGDEGSPEFEIYSTHLRRFHENRFYHYKRSVGDLVDQVRASKDGGKEHVIPRLLEEHAGKFNAIFIFRNDRVFAEEVDPATTTQKSLNNMFYSIRNPFLVFSEKETKKIMEDLQPLFVLLTQDGGAEGLKEMYTAHAKEQKNNSNFSFLSISGVSKKFANELLQEFEIEGERPSLPMLVYFQPDFLNLKMKKYAHGKGEISAASMKGFVKESIAGEGTPVRKRDSRKRYSFAPFEALNDSNLDATLEASDRDVVVVVFQMPFKYQRMKRMPSDLKNILGALDFFRDDPGLRFYLYNAETNELDHFMNHGRKPAFLVYLKGTRAKDLQVLQKKNILEREVVRLIDKRSQFDKRKMTGDGEVDFKNMDMAKMMEGIEGMDLSKLKDLEGDGQNLDLAAAMEKMQEMMKGMGGEL